MKLVHISDIHINADPVAGTDSVAEFAACLAHVEKRHGNADAVVISGDLTHHGQRHSYQNEQTENVAHEPPHKLATWRRGSPPAVSGPRGQVRRPRPRGSRPDGSP